jgi:SAM-dependent methyltransferase
MSLKQTVKSLCPDTVVSAYDSLVTTLQRSPSAAKYAVSAFKSLGPRWDEAKLRRKLYDSDAPMVPPMRIMADGTESLLDYKTIGDEYKNLFIKYANLEPTSAILDLGCGIGRCAVPLTGYLHSYGQYRGLDVDVKAVKWCQERITKRYRNFIFAPLDVYSNIYNPSGKIKASEVHLPCSDRSFDLVIAMSLFSHLFVDEAANYFQECHRILRPGGKMLFTSYVLNKESENLIAGGKGLKLVHPHGKLKVLEIETPDKAVGFPEQLLRDTIKIAGFEKTEIHPGSWCGRIKSLSQLDVIVCTKL